MLATVLLPSEKEALKHLRYGFLYDKGWWKSWETKSPLDLDSKALPWVTYSFIDFIENRLNKNMIIFEYGSGNSTIYYSSKVKKVYTVEHDIDWFNKVSQTLPKNVMIENVELEYGGEYSLTSQKKDLKFDVIIVDGRDRVNCIINSIESLKDNGVLILDDSERISYQLGIDKLKEDGFKSLDFWGISPGLFYKKCTSVYYKNPNVLDI
ncbi:hypothetical protein MB09_09065 [Aequorivita vladivostokensis]|uniref:FkbM family methyltransferase n=1 Tax=Aequorivita vladivostokensis TaxID=171194 RepID=A0ABR5DI10_9FLAO|nr:hypothetical protein MB09_09065 [Aequorivita vladivostokensis]